MYTAEMPTKVYIVLEAQVCSPNRLETKLKSNKPTKPQFKAPTKTSIRVSQSKEFSLLIKFFLSIYVLFNSNVANSKPKAY